MSKRILFIEPYYGGSHKSWFEQLKKYSKHTFKSLTLPARHWKWRMHSSPSIFSDQVNALRSQDFDLILCSEFLSINRFRGELSKEWRDFPILCYFHENQILYPWSQHDKESAYERNLIYVYHNLENLRAADYLIFNSRFHLESLMRELPKTLKTFPSPRPFFNLSSIIEKSTILPPGIEEDIILPPMRQNGGAPLILWNHRWDEDKNPQDFFLLIENLRKRAFEFRLALLGDFSRSSHKQKISQLPQNLIVYSGYQSRKDYIRIINEADIAPITSHHDFFGISAVESILTGNVVIPPNRMAYPEHFEKSEFEKIHFKNMDELTKNVMSYQKFCLQKSKEHCRSYLWHNLIHKYDSYFDGTGPS